MHRIIELLKPFNSIIIINSSPIPARSSKQPKHNNPRHPHQHTSTDHPQPPDALTLLTRPKRQPLLTKRHILLHTTIPALTAPDIQPDQIIRHHEKHIHALIQPPEPARIIREAIPRIGRTRVPQQDALDLPGERGRHGRVVAHDVGIRRVGEQDEFALGEGQEDLLEEESPDRERRRHVAEVEGSRVEGAEGVRRVDEVHVVARHLLRGRGEVVEVQLLPEGGRPVGVDGRHVHPRDVGFGEGVEEAEGGFVDLRDAEDVVDVRDDGQACGRHEVGCRVARVGAVRVDVDALDGGGAVSGEEVAARTGDVSEWEELVEIALDGRFAYECDVLRSSGAGECAGSAALRGSGLDVE